MRVCLSGSSAGGLLREATGGSERQLALLAFNLAHRGHDVTVVVPGYDGPDSLVDGVRLRSGWSPDRGSRIVRAFTYRYPHLVQVLRETRADVYYLRGFSYHTPVVVEAAHSVGGLPILALTSDGDLQSGSGIHHFGFGGRRTSSVIGGAAFACFQRFTLPRIKKILVQNHRQEETCRRLGLPHALLPSIVEAAPPALVETGPAVDAVWAGNTGWGNRRSKGLEGLVQLSERLPQVSFAIVGYLHEAEGSDLVRRLRRQPNVTLCGHMTHPQTLARIASAKVVINTSPTEGFSNVMLEGWSLGRPAVSLYVNPDSLLDNHGLGVCSHGDLDQMAAALSAVLIDDDLRKAMGDRAREYVEQVHGADRVCSLFEELVRSLQGSPQGAA